MRDALEDGTFVETLSERAVFASAATLAEDASLLNPLTDLRPGLTSFGREL